MSAKGWRSEKLGNLVEINAESITGDFPFKEIEYIDTSSVTNNRFGSLQKLKLNEAPSRAKRIVRDGDTIISTVRPIQRHFGFVRNPRPNTIASTGFAVLTAKKIHPEFLYYYLSQDSITYYLNGIAETTTTTFPAFRPDALEDLEVEIPDDIQVQQRIAAILSTLDDKIELNRQTNATLEAIAQAIFKEWFVNFNFPGTTGEMVESELGMIPKGWRVGKLGDVCQNIRKTVHPREIASDTAYVGLEHIPRKSLGLLAWGVSENVDSQKTRFKKYHILFGKLRPYFHKVCIAPIEGICSTDILVIESYKNDFFSFCLNHLFSNELITYVSAVADGTRMPRVDWNSISNYEVIIPPDNWVFQFNKIIFPFYDEIVENNQQSIALAAMRDTLLPKLMSGEIDV